MVAPITPNAILPVGPSRRPKLFVYLSCLWYYPLMKEGMPTGLLLTGGRGLRLDEYTGGSNGIQKCCTNVDGYIPLEEHVRQFSAAGIKDLVIVIGYKGFQVKYGIEQVRDGIGDGKKYGLDKVLYVNSPYPDGRGMAFKRGLGKIKGDCIVRNCDIFTPGLKLEDLIKFHREKGAMITMAAAKFNIKDAVGYSGFLDIENDRVTGFTENPTENILSGDVYINVGTHFINADIIHQLLRSQDFNGPEIDMLPHLIKAGCVYAYPVEYFAAFNKLEDLPRVREVLKSFRQSHERNEENNLVDQSPRQPLFFVE